MSDTTDDMEAGAALWEAHMERQQSLLDRKVWVTRDGQEIPIKEMEDSHLLNTLNFIRRGAESWRQKAIRSGEEALGFLQGEQAIWDIEQDLSFLEGATVDEVADKIHPYWELLTAEAEKRKLDWEEK